MIQDPYDLTDDIGEFELCQFSKVKDALEEVVEDRSHDFYFHHDPKHKYSFDERPFQSGAIYGRKQKRKEGENEGSKVTAGRLAPIKSTSQFEEHVKKVATVVEKRKASSSKKSKRTNKPRIDHYLLELCVVILKEKITKTSIPSVPNTLLACSSSIFSNIDEDNITPTVSSEEPPTKKKKTVYKFKADESVFCKANELNSIPSNEDLDLRLLNIYAQRHFNDTKDGKLLPQTYCFPPTNPDMMIAPPTYKEWKTTKKASNDILTAENFGSHNYVFRQAQIPDDRPQVVGFNATPSASKDEVVGLTFYLYDNDDDQASVIIDGNPLSLNSSMMDVLDEYNINDELLIINIEKCKFLIKLKSGLHLHLKYNRFHRMTVNTVISLENISDNYLIIIKECQ